MSFFRRTHISLDELLNTCLWLAGLTLIVLACLKVLDHPWGMLGLAAIVGASLRTVTTLLRGLQEREREFFEMGRDSMRSVNRR